MKQESRPSVLGALLTLLGVAGVIVWGVTFLGNNDPLWFLHVFNARADWIVIYWDGEMFTLFPEDPGYAAVMDAFAAGVANWSGYEGGVGMSDENLARYRDAERMLELHYNTPVQVHTRHPYPEARNFFVPLSGTHAHWRRVFAGMTEQPRIGVLTIDAARFETLLDAVEAALRSPLPL